jgi:hypothetical protein
VTPSSSLVPNRATKHTCWPNRTTCSLESALLRPPPDHHSRARSSAGSPSPATHLAPSLGHLAATSKTHCRAPSLSSPPSELPQPRRLCSAAGVRRGPPRPNLHHQSIEGKANRNPMPFVCLRRTHITGGGLPSAIEVLDVGGFGTRGSGRKGEG